jgi:hypothetical protein
MYRKIVLFFLLISFVFILGCQKNTEKAEQTVIKALKAMKNYDLKKAKKYINFVDLSLEIPELKNNILGEIINNEENRKLMISDLDFTLISFFEEEDKLIVKTEIENIDLGKIYHDCLRNFQMFVLISYANRDTKDELVEKKQIYHLTEQLFIDLLKKEDNQKRTVIIDLELNKTKHGWCLNGDREFQNAIWGGLINAIEAEELNKQELMSYKKKFWLLEQEIKNIEIEKEVIYPEKHRFIVEETAFYNLPFDFGPVVGLIPKNSVVEIEAVCQMNNERWLFIYFPCSNDFALFGSYGWLRETETQPYTENERELVEYPLYLEKGTHYYESLADIDQAKGNALSSRLTVVIIEEKGDYVEVTGPGTFYGWVKKEAIIYPEVD